MKQETLLEYPQKLHSIGIESEILSDFLKCFAQGRGRLEILEAGCGRRWPIDLQGVEFSLVGIDIDQDALDIRTRTSGDLSLAILSDLRAAEFEERSFDVIYSAFVLEHIRGAEQVLDNFVRWLKPGGCIILKIPNRDSVKGFVTRLTPFWFHIFYTKHIRGIRKAGKPGFGPYPTAFDEIVSRDGIHHFYRDRGLEMMGEYYYSGIRDDTPKTLALRLEMAVVSLIERLSGGRLSAQYVDLTYILRKP